MLSGCATVAPEAVTPDLRPGRKAAQGAAASTSCYNMVYAFTCVPPPGFLITSEAAGPGKILTLVKSSQTTQEEDNLSLRVYPLRKRKLARFVEERIIVPARQASGVSDIESRPANVGMREGLEVLYERRYANSTFRTRFFCFERGQEVYVAEHTVPARRPDKGPDPLEAFVASLAFR